MQKGCRWIMEDLRVPKRIGHLILNALEGGVVPRTGLGYIAVGREKEILTLLNDLEILELGGATFRLVVGNYGSGKTFLLQTFKENALAKDYVVADADLSPDRNLIGAGINKRGLATFQELMTNLSTKSSPTGGGFKRILDTWMNNMWMESAKQLSTGQVSGKDLESIVAQKIQDIIFDIKEMIHGYDLAKVLSSYWHASRQGENEKKEQCIRWLRGEYGTRQAARRDLDVNSIIDDENWFDYVKNYSLFFHKIGYKGLIVLIDELINLYRCRRKETRDKNYEKMLGIYNDCLQGKAQHLGIVMGGTPVSITNKERGIYSYEALRSRLEVQLFSSVEAAPMSTIITIKQLSKAELIVLLEKLLQIHEDVYEYHSSIDTENIVYFVNVVLNNGDNLYITPRSIIRDFLRVIDYVHQDGKIAFIEFISKLQFSNDIENDTEE